MSGIDSSILTRPTKAEVELSALSHNLKVVKKRVSPARVMAVVKANAYGHGLVESAKAFEEAGADYFGVAYLEEGVALRKAGISKPIHVLGGILTSQLQLYFDYDLDITASSVDKLAAIEHCAERLKKKARIQLKIDTGMERLGVHYYSANELLERASESKWCEVEGIFSHFARSEEEDQTTSKLQLERFLEVCSFYEKRSLKTPARHIGCSGSILQFPESHLDMVRPGLILYGAAPATHLADVISLERAMALKTTIVYFKVVKKGASVSYGHTWTADRDTRVVTLPVGYGDGYSTMLSNRGEVLIRGKRYPIVGRVCMDQMMVDLGPGGEGYNADEVILIGKQGGDEITIEEVTEAMGIKNPRELFVLLNDRIPRVFV